MARMGIDLGTANSAVAIFLDDQEISDTNPFVIEPMDGTSDGAYIIPSYLAFSSDGTPSAIGLAAKERYRRGDSPIVLRNLKRLIGRPYRDVLGRATRGERSFAEFKERLRQGKGDRVELQVGPRTQPVEDLVALLLEKIIGEGQETAHQRGDAITSVTISLPAGFDDMQREATLRAAVTARGKLTARQIVCAWETVRVIEEPTAAALARGLDGATGTVLVIDIGAGTTDIVAGPMHTDTGGSPYVSQAARMCDDELGGIDMDNLILEYVLAHDALQPRLSDVYPALPMSEKGKLMAAIENAKIMASLTGSGLISLALRVGTRAKPINLALPDTVLKQIVAPVLMGRRCGETIKGVKPLVEKTLLELAMITPERLTRALRDPRHAAAVSYLDPHLLRAAGYDASDVAARVQQVIGEIEHVVLVGGPCRMSAVHDLLADVFASNVRVREQLTRTDRSDNFFMEAVARGATMGRGTVQARVPYNISTFTWGVGGRTVIVPRGTPYLRDEEVIRSGVVPVEAGGQTLHVLSEKDCPREHWPYRQYEVALPKAGSATVTLSWKEEGLESNRASIEGTTVGIVGKLQFPPLKDTATLGEKVRRSYGQFLDVAKRFRQDLPVARQRCEDQVRRIVRRLNPEETEEAMADLVKAWMAEQFIVTESDLQRCDALDPEAMVNPTEEELERIPNEGYFKVRDDIAVRRWGLTENIITALGYFFTDVPQFGTADLIQAGDLLLTEARRLLPSSNEFVRQVLHHLEALRQNPKDGVVGAHLATANGALAQDLRTRGPASVEGLYEVALFMAHCYQPDQLGGDDE